jgi:hypothetical protein
VQVIQEGVTFRCLEAVDLPFTDFELPQECSLLLSSKITALLADAIREIVKWLGGQEGFRGNRGVAEFVSLELAQGLNPELDPEDDMERIREISLSLPFMKAALHLMDAAMREDYEPGIRSAVCDLFGNEITSTIHERTQGLVFVGCGELMSQLKGSLFDTLSTAKKGSCLALNMEFDLLAIGWNNATKRGPAGPWIDPFPGTSLKVATRQQGVHRCR